MSLATVSSRQTPARDAAISQKPRMHGAMIASYTKISVRSAHCPMPSISTQSEAIAVGGFRMRQKKERPPHQPAGHPLPGGARVKLPKRGDKLQHPGSRSVTPSPLGGEGWGEGALSGSAETPSATSNSREGSNIRLPLNKHKLIPHPSSGCGTDQNAGRGGFSLPLASGPIEGSTG